MKKHSSKNTSEFYNELVKGKNKFTFFSNETRFNIENILHKENLIKYFDNNIKSHISDNLNILDYGCGPGTFLMKLNKLSNSNLYGVDISDEFIEQSINNFKKYNINNIKVQKVEPEKLPFEDQKFDVILIVDVIHHLDDIKKNINEIKRILKKGGKLLIYEPNKLNPLIWLTHLIDKNERGLLRVGSFRKYREIFDDKEFEIIQESYNGIVIGPSSKIFDKISNFLNHKAIYPFLGFLNPKIFLVINKN